MDTTHRQTRIRALSYKVDKAHHNLADQGLVDHPL